MITLASDEARGHVWRNRSFWAEQQQQAESGATIWIGRWEGERTVWVWLLATQPSSDGLFTVQMVENITDKSVISPLKTNKEKNTTIALLYCRSVLVHNADNATIS